MTFSAPRAPDSGEATARACLTALIALVSCNLLFNIVMRALGFDLRFTSFLGYWHDAFADYFKFILSYPGGSAVRLSDSFGLAGFVSAYTADNPYKGVEGLSQGLLTHLHVTPFTTAYALVNLQLMRWIDPQILFVAQISAAFCYAWHIVRRENADFDTAVRLFALFAISYPTLTMLTRGNLFAGLAALCLIDAMLRALRGRSPVAGALLLAIAINVRPNAAIFVLPFILFQHRRWLTAGISAGLATCILGGASLLFAHLVYPEYGIASFLAGLRTYYGYYVLGGLGWPYGSSLFAGLLLIVGFNPAFDMLSACFAGVIYLMVVNLFLRGRLDRVALLFATCATYTLASTIFADYHLMVFLVVPVAIVTAQREQDAYLSACHKIALVATVLVLAPKNYAFFGPMSWQVALNPAILLGALFWMIGRNLDVRSPGPASRAPEASF